MDGTTGVSFVDHAAIWATAIAAVLALGGLLWRLARPLRRVVRRIEELADDWHGVPARPGVEGRPGVMERLSRIEHAMGAVVHEVRPNAGGSMRDAMDRVDRRTASILGEPPPSPRLHDDAAEEEGP
ncbi:hypothetical protein [Actinacidiphila sp. ITFR-21]|uniref:hypothetical protein n=1 Tax=Actinacidiphila sp. ITFR-21 TaxID=3075199 RepID=UPI00288959AD|nr:hypothetical protein [Streptomyces sp. ITFR-21]WNI20296.1 hypothetical protein RLT57_33045 [Streptomyces sp. ITFR-21]